MNDPTTPLGNTAPNAEPNTTPDTIPTADAMAAHTAATHKGEIRTAISHKVGDTASLVGTTADTAQMLLVMMSELITALHQTRGSAHKPLREAMAKWQPVTEAITNAHTAGTLTLPYEVKGLDDTLASILARAAATANILNTANTRAANKP